MKHRHAFAILSLEERAERHARGEVMTDGSFLYCELCRCFPSKFLADDPLADEAAHLALPG